MTTREYFQAVLDAHISPEMDSTSTLLIERLDAKNAKRKATPTKAQKESFARRDAVADFFKSNPETVFTRDEVAEKLGISPAQATAGITPLVSAGLLKKEEVKIGKARKMAYVLA